MKSLGEVIKAFECCGNDGSDSCEECSYTGIYCCIERNNDALHYLKQLQKIEDEYDELKDWWAEEHAENVPLTWNELKHMEGKPVWIEIGICKIWGLNDGVYVDAFGKEMVTIKVLHDLWHLRKEKMDDADGWQAYRKERE